MGLVPNFTAADVEDNFDQGSFKRAQSLIRLADVSSAKFIDDATLQLDGTVLGTHRYSTHVTVTETPARMSSRCSCPVGVKCKHAVALALRFLRDAPAPDTAATGLPHSSQDKDVEANAGTGMVAGTQPGRVGEGEQPTGEESPSSGTERLLDMLRKRGIDPSSIYTGSELAALRSRDAVGNPPNQFFDQMHSPGAVPADPVPAWERQLNELIEELAAPQPVERAPLALRFSVEEKPSSRWNPNPTPMLHILPMKKGKRGTWIKSGVSWTALDQPWNETKFLPGQFAALTQVTEALHAHGTEPVSSYQLQEATPGIWNALIAARDAGVEFLAEGLADRVELAEEPVQVNLGVTGEDGNISALLGVAFNGYTCAGSAVTTIGRRAFAVALLPSEATEGSLVLARLRTPLSERITMVLGYGQEINVPAKDRQRFAKQVLPKLAPHVPVASDDPEFHQEPPQPPALVARIGWDPTGRISLDFLFRYPDGDGHTDVPVSAGATAAGLARQPLEERSLLDQWQHGPATQALVRFRGNTPADSMAYAGLEAVNVVRELAPELSTQMLVEIQDDVPDFHDVVEDPDISFDLEDSGEDPRLAKRRPDRDPSGEPSSDRDLAGGDSAGEDPANGADTGAAQESGLEAGPDDEADLGKEVHEDAEDQHEIDWLDLRVVIVIDGVRVPLPVVLAALTRGDEVLLLEGGGVIRLDHPALKRLAGLVKDAEGSGLQAANPDSIRLGTRDASLFEEVENLGVLPEAAQKWQQMYAVLRQGGQPPHVDAVGVSTPLREYQQAGLNWMHHLYQHQLGGILADDMGLGKTLQTLALISTVKGQRRAGRPELPFLVVAPTSVVPAWKLQAEQHTPGLKVATITSTAHKRKESIAEIATSADVVVTSYTLLRREKDDYAELAWKGLILDESQAIKNPASKTFQAVRDITADFALAVTGTPFENRLTELWPPLSIVAPGLYPTLDAFKAKVANPVEKDGDTDALALMRKKIAPFLLRRSKSLVAQDLPEKQEGVLTVALEKSHRRFYDTLLQRERQSVLGLVEDFEQNRVAIFAALTRMRLAALHAGLAGGDPDTPSAKLTELIQRLTELSEEGHRALVFSQFTSYLKIIRTALEAAGLECVYLDGSTRDRGKVLKTFTEGSAPVFLISLKAGGSGITLTEADYVFVMDPWWNPAVEAQAVDRAHRIGQTRQVMVYRMVSENTIEEKVMALKERKSALFEQVIGDGTGESGPFIDEDDIRGLLE